MATTEITFVEKGNFEAYSKSTIILILSRLYNICTIMIHNTKKRILYYAKYKEYLAPPNAIDICINFMYKMYKFPKKN